MNREAEGTRPLGRRIGRAWLKVRARIARFLLLPQLSAEDAQALRGRVLDDGALSQGYVLMCALSAGIATLGLLQSSTAVVIGAMLISPLMGPIAALGFAFASLDGHRIRDAARVVAIGAIIGIATGILLTWLSPIRNATPEIIARTQPTLLDLAVALLSGIAGGYATVRGKGGTAIGVAIATALMPPLATLGYGLGTFRPTFALGALLLFLTNLSAIAFAFAIVARLSGAARPLRRVEMTPGYIAAGLAAFLVLATPLAMTLSQLVTEARMRQVARAAIMAATGVRQSGIAQLDASWPLFGKPQIAAVVIGPRYTAKAEERLAVALAKEMGRDVVVNLQQVMAADVTAQTRAIVDAAMQRTIAGIDNDVPPFARIRGSVGLPTHGIWVNRAERIVHVEPVAGPGWTLVDYHRAERDAEKVGQGWRVELLPPVSAAVTVPIAQPAAPASGNSELAPSPELAMATEPIETAIWALRRWGMDRVHVLLPEGEDGGDLRRALEGQGIVMVVDRDGDRPEPGVAVLQILTPPLVPTE